MEIPLENTFNTLGQIYFFAYHWGLEPDEAEIRLMKGELNKQEKKILQRMRK